MNGYGRLNPSLNPLNSSKVGLGKGCLLNLTDPGGKKIGIGDPYGAPFQLAIRVRVNAALTGSVRTGDDQEDGLVKLLQEHDRRRQSQPYYHVEPWPHSC